MDEENKKKKKKLELTNLDVAAGVQEHVVALDIAVDNALRMKVLKATTCLFRQLAGHVREDRQGRVPQDRSWRFALR